MKLKIQNILLYIFIFSLNFEVWDPLNTGGNFSVAKLSGFIYAISLFPKIESFIKIHRFLKIEIRFLIFFYLLLVINNFLNINFRTEYFLEFSILQNIILFIFLVNHERLSPGVIEKSLTFFLLGSLVLTIFFFLGFGVQISLYENRISILGDNENVIGSRMAISSLVLTHLILKVKKNKFGIRNIILIGSYFPLIALSINTGSRLAFVSIFLGLFFMFIIYQKKGLLSKIFVVLTSLLSAYFIFQMAIQSEVLGSRLKKTAEEGHLSGRDEIWETIFPLIENNLIFGTGVTGYTEYSYQNFGQLLSPHNVVIEVLVYTGIIGFILFFGFTTKVFIVAYKYYKKFNFAIPLIFIIPISGIILSGQILTFKLAWVIFAYAASRKFYLLNDYRLKSNPPLVK